MQNINQSLYSKKTDTEGDSCQNFGEYWPRYNGTALYSNFISLCLNVCYFLKYYSIIFCSDLIAYINFLQYHKVLDQMYMDLDVCGPKKGC